MTSTARLKRLLPVGLLVLALSIPSISSVAAASTYDVTAYGARGDGKTDNTPAFARAIAAAQAGGGGVVTISAGRYIFKTGTHGRSITVPKGPAVTLQGAGRDTTTLVSSVKGLDLVSLEADHSTLTAVTLDEQALGNGLAFRSNANYTTLSQSRVLGAQGNFAVRFTGGHGTSNRFNPIRAQGNTVDNLILVDHTLSQNDGLDFSYQANGTIQHVVHTGMRLGLYIDSNILVNDYHFTPGPGMTQAYGWDITSPAQNITIKNFVTSGAGGKINPSPPGPARVADSITIVSEVMTGGSQFHMQVGDVTHLEISQSKLGTLLVMPSITAQGIVSASTYTLQANAASDLDFSTRVPA
jgi:hypothetical protein